MILRNIFSSSPRKWRYLATNSPPLSFSLHVILPSSHHPHHLSIETRSMISNFLSLSLSVYLSLNPSSSSPTEGRSLVAKTLSLTLCLFFPSSSHLPHHPLRGYLWIPNLSLPLSIYLSLIPSSSSPTEGVSMDSNSFSPSVYLSFSLPTFRITH